MTKRILKAAQNRIRKYGWTQHTIGDKTIGFCAAGAIYEGRAIYSNKYRAVDALEQLIDVELTSWNDKPGRTKRQVLGLFQRAINKL